MTRYLLIYDCIEGRNTMSKLTKEELRDLKYVSMADFYQRVKKYEDMNDKLCFATQYLLLHGSKSQPDYSIVEAIYIAQLAISEASAEAKKDMPEKKDFFNKNKNIVNPHAKNEKEDLSFELFMNDPLVYLQGYAKKNLGRINDLTLPLPPDIRLKESCNELISERLDTLNCTDDVYTLVSEKNNIGTLVRAQAKVGGKEQFDAICKASKPGFFARFFGSTSLAGKNLDYVFNSFNNPNHALYGDKDAMKKAAVEYLQHKFPNWKPGTKLPDISGNTKLDATGKARATLSAALIESLEEQHLSEEPLKDVVDATKEKDISFKDIDRPLDNQGVFHNKILDDLDDELSDSSIDLEDDLNKGLNKDDEKLDIDRLLDNIELDK